MNFKAAKRNQCRAADAHAREQLEEVDEIQVDANAQDKLEDKDEIRQAIADLAMHKISWRTTMRYKQLQILQMHKISWRTTMKYKQMQITRSAGESR